MPVTVPSSPNNGQIATSVLIIEMPLFAGLAVAGVVVQLAGERCERDGTPVDVQADRMTVVRAGHMVPAADGKTLLGGEIR